MLARSRLLQTSNEKESYNSGPAKLAPMTTESQVLKYLQDTNRPFNAINVADALAAQGIKKSQVRTLGDKNLRARPCQAAVHSALTRLILCRSKTRWTRSQLLEKSAAWCATGPALLLQGAIRVSLCGVL